MQYISYSKEHWQVSRFGVGCMRFPKGDDGTLDQAQIDQMVQYAIENDVNYFDTAYVYQGSEIALGKALKKLNARSKVRIATKVPPWSIKSYADFERLLDIELERLQTDYTDVCLLHCMQEGTWATIMKHDGLKFLDEMKKKGKIKLAAFSFHDRLPLFKEIVDAYPWDMCQIQLNYLDEKFQAGVDGAKYAHSKGLTVVAMEPLKGGALADELPAPVQDFLNNQGNQRSFVEWAFRWLYDMPEIAVVLSGVSSMEQLKDNIHIFNAAEAGCMTEQEKTMIQTAANIYRENVYIGCTGCAYCMPCPQGVDIPETFKKYNETKTKRDASEAYGSYKGMIKQKKDASQCVECGLCMSHCPQSLEIIHHLKEAHKILMSK